MCVCMYIYIYIHTYTHTHTHIHIYIYIYIYTYYLLITLTTPWEKIVTAVLAQSSHVSPHWCFPGSIHAPSCSSGRQSSYEQGPGFRVSGRRFWDLGKLSSRYRTPEAVEARKLRTGLLAQARPGGVDILPCNPQGAVSDTGYKEQESSKKPRHSASRFSASEREGCELRSSVGGGFRPWAGKGGVPLPGFSKGTIRVSGMIP